MPRFCWTNHQIQFVRSCASSCCMFRKRKFKKLSNVVFLCKRHWDTIGESQINFIQNEDADMLFYQPSPRVLSMHLIVLRNTKIWLISKTLKRNTKIQGLTGVQHYYTSIVFRHSLNAFLWWNRKELLFISSIVLFIYAYNSFCFLCLGEASDKTSSVTTAKNHYIHVNWCCCWFQNRMAGK